MSAIFLTAAWRKLAMANYPVDPASLRPFLPARTELDTWAGDTYVSLVGFQFRDIRVKGLRIPFHTDFPEVNLRFYVRYKERQQWKRGVVFIRETVPLPAVTFLANTLFHERYITLPMRYFDTKEGSHLRAGYYWKYKGRWNELTVEADSVALPLENGSQTEFITEHFWGYAGNSAGRTGEYQVDHPRWEIYNVNAWQINCDFGQLYGPAFTALEKAIPQSVFLAEGSPVDVYTKRFL